MSKLPLEKWHALAETVDQVCVTTADDRFKAKKINKKRISKEVNRFKGK